jgi:peptidoglycan/xylan/chitin deacetylase (PgdA/CDA1 family)
MMRGFLAKAIEVHRRHEIPVSFFCTGGAIDARETEFREFHQAVKDDPLFDCQDHSYSHVGLGYENGPPLEVLEEDYGKSFASHARVFGVRPVGISICGVREAKPRLAGFDATGKSRAEFERVAGLGLRMINSFLSGGDESRDFISYASLGHPDVMGFPSCYSDTSWVVRREHGDPMAYILGEMESRAGAGDPMPVMLHDWVAWNHMEDKDLTHVVRIADRARALGYELRTHRQCLDDDALWRESKETA